jgi:hypothetical protein
MDLSNQTLDRTVFVLFGDVIPRREFEEACLRHSNLVANSFVQTFSAISLTID